jgi:hypothetical protein
MTLFPRRTRGDVNAANALLFGSILNGFGDKLRSVIAAQIFRITVAIYGCLQDLDGISGPQRIADLESQTLLGIFINQAQDPKTAAMLGLVVKQIPTPELIDAFCAQPFDHSWSQFAESFSAVLLPGARPGGESVAPAWH